MKPNETNRNLNRKMSMEDIQQQKLRQLQAIEETIKAVFHREPIDTVVPIGTNRPYFLDYKDRKYVYAYSSTALTLTLEDIGTVSITANQWTNICFPEGLRMYAVGKSVPVVILVRCTDELYSFDSQLGVAFPSSEIITLSGSQAINLARSGGVSIDANHPLASQTYLQNITITLAQSLMATAGNIATATNGNLIPCALSLFNPATTNVAALVYSIQTAADTGFAGVNNINKTTTDPSGTTGYTNTSITVTNMDFDNATGSQLSFCASPNGVTASPTQVGTDIEAYGIAKGINELISEGGEILVTPGTGLAIYSHVNTLGDAFPCTVKWVEYPWAPNSSGGGGSTGGGSTGGGGTTTQYLQLIKFSDNQNTSSQVDNIYCAGTNLLFYWAQLEPNAQGVYDWTSLDAAIAPWAAAGKKVFLRVSTAGWKNWAPPYSQQGTPQWLFNQSGGPSKVTESDGAIKPQYWNTKYLSALQQFINALAARYDGRSYLGGIQCAIGDGGECKVDSFSNSNKLSLWTNIGYTDSLWWTTIQTIIGYYRSAFTKTQLIQQMDIDFLQAIAGQGTGFNQDDLTSYVLAANSPVNGKLWIQNDGMVKNQNLKTALANAMKTVPVISEQRNPVVANNTNPASGDTMQFDLQLANTQCTSRYFLIFASDLANTANTALFQEYTGH